MMGVMRPPGSHTSLIRIIDYATVSEEVIHTKVAVACRIPMHILLRLDKFLRCVVSMRYANGCPCQTSWQISLSYSSHSTRSLRHAEARNYRTTQPNTL